jgi:hypothetical protein
MAKDSPELTAYKALRASVAARLADPEGASQELRALATRVLAVSDSLAGLSSDSTALAVDDSSLVQQVGTFEQQLAHCCVLSSSEWGSVAIPSELYRLASVVASA